MNEKISLLNYRNLLKNNEASSFYSEHGELVDELISYIDTDGPESESPDVVMIIPTSKSILQTEFASFHEKIKLLQSALQLPRKFVETEKMNQLNVLRISDFGTIKKKISNAYQNDKNNKAAEKLWFHIRVCKNLNVEKESAVSSILSKFIMDMKSDEFKHHCESLELTVLLSSLDEKNQEYLKLLYNRSINVKVNYKSVKPYRKACDASYLRMDEMINSFINLDKTENLSVQIIKINAHVKYYNDIIQRKITASKTKKENKPIVPVIPDPSTPVTVVQAPDNPEPDMPDGDGKL